MLLKLNKFSTCFNIININLINIFLIDSTFSWCDCGVGGDRGGEGRGGPDCHAGKNIKTMGYSTMQIWSVCDGW